MYKNWTIIELLKTTTDFFNEKQIESPRLNAELLLCKILKCDRIDLYTKYDKPLSEKEVNEYRELVRKRAKKEPLQYLLEEIEFYNIKLKIDKRALIPRPETEELVDLIISNHNQDSYEILDIGTGSACIPIALAVNYPHSKLLSVDISQDAIDLANENIKLNNVSNLNLQIMDILNEEINKKFDIIVSNPPYISQNEMQNIKKELSFEPQIALTDFGDGLTFYKRYLEIFKSILKPNGKFYLEIAYNQREEIFKLFNNSIFEIEIIKDINSLDRIIVGKFK